MLFLGDDGHHQPKARFDQLRPVLQSRNIDATYTDRISDVTIETLRQYNALVLYGNIDQIEKANADAILAYVEGGGGFVPLHCASFCFRNSPELVALMGGQFQRHGTGVFRASPTDTDHPILDDYSGFESWDETYVHHLHNELNRTVLEYRIDAEGREPWTWVRTQERGRVFYTAWGHDSRTWSKPGFQNLVERGIRWVAKQDPSQAGPYRERDLFPAIEMTTLPSGDKPFTFTDVGAQIPNYTAGKKWGVQGELKTKMQEPLPPTESAKRYVTPKGMHLELWAAEKDLRGKPISMNWDERGRLWVCETMDYPNELQPKGKGRDRIRICEDTNGDGAADRFTLFAENLSIPTTLICYRGGVIVQDGVETIYLKDVDGDDKADFRQSLITGWALGDTHGGVSNFQYGLDNWIWGMQGYNASTPMINGVKQQGFRQGFWRFRVSNDATASATAIGADASRENFSEHTLRVDELEFIRSTDNNTWGLGISEDGLIFGSTANRDPSVFMPIPNRYYEQVRGWSPSTLHMISDTHLFDPITTNVRQVDHHGGYTAAAGHSIYTGRKYPQEWWNRTAFVCGPTGHLTGTFVLTPDGAGFKSTSPFNMIASDDEWAAPIMAETGPDGFVWILDWYNYIVQHNPTPHGFETGKGNAYETDLRDKKHGRIYRVVTDSETQRNREDWLTLSNQDPSGLIATLKHPTMLWRRQAQRLLVERGDLQPSESSELIRLIGDQDVDPIGLNVGAIHALWVLDGLGKIGTGNDEIDIVVRQALSHPSAGVRRAAIGVLGNGSLDQDAMRASGVVSDSDPQVQLAALLKVADMPSIDGDLVNAIVGAAGAIGSDRWLLDAWTSAAASHVELVIPSVLRSASDQILTDLVTNRIAIVTEHLARSRPTSKALGELVSSMSSTNIKNAEGVLRGLIAGWPSDHRIELTTQTKSELVGLFDQAAVDQQSQLVQLSEAWATDVFSEKMAKLGDSLLDAIEDRSSNDAIRIGSARRLVAMQPTNDKVVEALLDTVEPQTPPALALGILDALNASRSESLAERLIDKAVSATPAIREAVVRLLMSRSSTTLELIGSIEAGKLRLSDLALNQRQALGNHPDKLIRSKANALLAKSDGIPTADRAKLLHDWESVAQVKGNATNGALVFKKACATCHRHGTEGGNVGPDLTGMAVHPKQELLTHILDPNQSVEGNFRTYTVLTVDGGIFTGMLGGESRTSIDLIDVQGKKSTILREEIEELSASSKSLMPEGFESQISRDAMADLLEFLTTRGKYTPLSFSGIATVVSTQGMFGNTNTGPDRIVFDDWNTKTFAGVPFSLVDPSGGRVPNVILLHGPNGTKPPLMPKEVSLTCHGPAAAIHILGGVSGWGFPYLPTEGTTVTVRLNYANGKPEDHELKNGVHLADYIRRVDVPGSEHAFDVQGQQVRYIKLVPERDDPLESIQLIKGNDICAPIFVAITIESR